MTRLTFLNCVIIFMVLTRAIHSHVSASDAFMPGDSFFLSCLDAEMSCCRYGQNGDQGQITLQYRTAVEWSAMNGRAGYQYLAIRGMTSTDMDLLVKLYSHLRKTPDYPKVVEFLPDPSGTGIIRPREVNPFYLLVYNSDLVFCEEVSDPTGNNESRRYPHVGLLYNENWMIGGDDIGPFGDDRARNDRDFRQQKSMKMGSASYRDFGIYRSLVEEKEAIIEDWRDATSFSGLNVSGLDSNRARHVSDEGINDVITISSGAVQMVIVAPSEIGHVFNGTGGALFVVKGGKVFEVHLNNQECQVTEMNLPGAPQRR